MTLGDVVKELDLDVRTGTDHMDRAIEGGYVSDLLSDVIAGAKEGDLWMTLQIHQNIVAVASLKDLAGIILVRGAEPAEDTLQKAVEENIPLFTADLPAFELAGRIYEMIGPRKA